MQEVRLPSVRRDYSYAVAFTFPAGLLAEGDSLRAQIRQGADFEELLGTFTVEREGDTVTISLSEAQTALLPKLPKATVDLVVVSGGVEYAITSPRFVMPVENHATRKVA